MYPPYTVHLHKKPPFLFWSIYTNGKPLPVLKNGAVSNMPAAGNPKASARQRVQNAAKGAEICRSTGPKFRPAAVQGKTCQFPFGRIVAMVFIRGGCKGANGPAAGHRAQARRMRCTVYRMRAKARPAALPFLLGGKRGRLSPIPPGEHAKSPRRPLSQRQRPFTAFPRWGSGSTAGSKSPCAPAAGHGYRFPQSLRPPAPESGHSF